MLEHFRCTSSGKNGGQVELWGPGHAAPSPRKSQALGRWQNVGLEHEWGTGRAGSCPSQQGGAHLPCELDRGGRSLGGQRAYRALDHQPSTGTPLSRKRT